MRELAVRVSTVPSASDARNARPAGRRCSGPVFCSAAGVLLRAACGPREAVSARKLMSRQMTDADAPKVHCGGMDARAAGWLLDKL